MLSLDLCSNGIGDEGATAVAETLSDNCHIRSLVLADNHIGPQGIAAICTSLRTSSTLTCLDLSGNPLGVRGGHTQRAPAGSHALSTLATLLRDSQIITLKSVQGISSHRIACSMLAISFCHLPAVIV